MRGKPKFVARTDKLNTPGERAELGHAWRTPAIAGGASKDVAGYSREQQRTYLGGKCTKTPPALRLAVVSAQPHPREPDSLFRIHPQWMQAAAGLRTYGRARGREGLRWSTGRPSQARRPS